MIRRIKIAAIAACLALSGCGGSGDSADCRPTSAVKADELWLSVKGAPYAAGDLDYKAFESGLDATLSGSFDLSVSGYGDAEITVMARFDDGVTIPVASIRTTAGSLHKSFVVVPDVLLKLSTLPKTSVLYVQWQSTGTDAFVTLRNRSITVTECLSKGRL